MSLRTQISLGTPMTPLVGHRQQLRNLLQSEKLDYFFAIPRLLSLIFSFV